jgi:hypothetical protein
MARMTSSSVAAWVNCWLHLAYAGQVCISGRQGAISLICVLRACGGHGYARKKRGAPQDETGQYEEDDSQAAREDDDGCLREERQDDS